MTDFDPTITTAKNQFIKYDRQMLQQLFGTDDIEPFWVADMDFQVAGAITEEFQRLIDRGVYAYELAASDVFHSIVDWNKNRHSLHLDDNAFLQVPGVLAGIALLLREITQPEDGILIQSPVYHQFAQLIKTANRKIIDNPLRIVGGRYEMDFDDLEEKLAAAGVMGLFIGITRSGKSTPIKSMIKDPRKAKRILVWDAKNEYGPSLGLTVTKTLPHLLNTLKTKKGNGRFSYVPTGFSKQEFDNFCRLAHTWNRQKEAIIVIEELAAVTNTGKASGYWGVLVNQSLGLGATLFATVQRGQEVDKSVMNAASYLYVCQHNTGDDAKYMAKKLGVELSAIPREPLKYMVWSSSKVLMKKGKVNFKKIPHTSVIQIF